MNVEKSVIAITGAGGGLGAAMARRLAAQGARLALLDYQTGLLNDIASGLDMQEDDLLLLQCDVSKEAEVDEAFAKAAEHFGRLDVLVNNAGITRDALTLKFRDGELVSRMSLEHWQAVIDVNLTGVFLCGRAAAEQMVRAGNGGLIVNISSISRAGNVGQANYSATKAGVAAMTVTWSKEFARYGIRVNTICPTFIRTPLGAQTLAIPERRRWIEEKIKLGRVGEGEDIMGAVVYLASDASALVTGSSLLIDGGWTAD